MQTVKHKGSDDTQEQYKGIPVHTVPGVHQRIGEVLAKHLSPGSRVADLGAGDGALSLRLHDLGFEVVAFDLDTSGWKLKDLPCYQVDFDRDLSILDTKGPFAAICAVEVIEHLENPRSFLRGMIRAGGPGLLRPRRTSLHGGCASIRVAGEALMRSSERRCFGPRVPQRECTSKQETCFICPTARACTSRR